MTASNLEASASDLFFGLNFKQKNEFLVSFFGLNFKPKKDEFLVSFFGFNFSNQLLPLPGLVHELVNFVHEVGPNFWATETTNAARESSAKYMTRWGPGCFFRTHSL